MKRLLLLTVCATVLAAPAFAQSLPADANRDGKVTSDEYVKSRHDYIMAADRDKDGKVSRDEWTRAASQERINLEEQGVANTQIIGKGGWFELIDANRDNFMTPAEIDTMTAARFQRLDANHDGGITRSEAANLVRKVTDGK